MDQNRSVKASVGDYVMITGTGVKDWIYYVAGMRMKESMSGTYLCKPRLTTRLSRVPITAPAVYVSRDQMAKVSPVTLLLELRERQTVFEAEAKAAAAAASAIYLIDREGATPHLEKYFLLSARLRALKQLQGLVLIDTPALVGALCEPVS